MIRARFVRAITLALPAMLAAGCAHDLTQARSPCHGKPGGWCEFTREMAVESWEYAQLSNNTYDDDEAFPVLPEGIVERYNSGNDDIGYAYAVFDRFKAGRLVETILAYRGTEASLDDWIKGNFERRQNPRGQATYDQLRSQLDDAGWQDVPITVTGHSLGGGIATYVSLRTPRTAAYVFNTSPRFVLPDAPEDNRRISVTERGEALRILRDFSENPPVDMYVLNCRPGGGLFTNHSVRKLAECLTWIAGYVDGRARASVVDNDIQPPLIEQMYRLGGGYPELVPKEDRDTGVDLGEDPMPQG